jgi:hypothetical protein
VRAAPLLVAGLAWALAATAADAALTHVATVAAEEAPTVRAGESATLRVTVTIKPGYHVQANPVLNPALKPLLLTVQAPPSIRAGAPVYPQAKRLRLTGSDEDLVIYDGTFVLELPVSVSKDSRPGDTVFEGALRYQACDDRRCLMPRTLPVQLKLRVRAP